MKLVFYERLHDSEFNKVTEWIKQVNIASKIRKVYFVFGGFREYETIGSGEKLLTSCSLNVEWITFCNRQATKNSVDPIAHFMNQTAFESLKVFEYIGFTVVKGGFMGTTIETVNTVLEMVTDKVKKKTKFYFIGDFTIDYIKSMDSLFDTFYQKVFNLMIKYQIPIDISLKIVGVYAIHASKWDNLVAQLAKRVLSDYKVPQCNKYCVPLVTPAISITRDEKRYIVVIYIKSAQKQG